MHSVKTLQLRNKQASYYRQKEEHNTQKSFSILWTWEKMSVLYSGHQWVHLPGNVYISLLKVLRFRNRQLCNQTFWKLIIFSQLKKLLEIFKLVVTSKNSESQCFSFPLVSFHSPVADKMPVTPI
jgi:hypothetical protein